MITTIEKIPKGELFKLLNGKAVLVAEGYCRTSKKYTYSRYDDINHYGAKKKGTQVLNDWATPNED